MQNPDPSTFKFYCPAQTCWCLDDSICEKRVALIKRQVAKTQNAKGSPFRVPEVDALSQYPNLYACVECEKGHKMLNPETRGRPATGRSSCIWPGCNEYVAGHGLCNKHYQLQIRSRLVRAETKKRPQQAKAMVEILAQVCEETGMEVEEVVYRALVDGLENYLSKSRQVTTETETAEA